MKKVNCAIISLLAACLVLLMVVLILLGTGVLGVGNATNNGKSAYELAVEAGFKGTYEQWLESLKGSSGANGSNGKSAFEIFKEYNPDYTGTEEEWLESLKGDRGATWFSGTGVPTEVEGARDGDFYLLVYGDFSSKKGFVIYQMTDGQWVALVDMSSDVSAEERQATKEFNVRSSDDLADFAESVVAGDSYKGKTILLQTDLDLSGIDNWTPIGSKSAAFSGTFDGQNKTISNLKVESGLSNTNANWCKGLFGNVSNGTIQNLVIENAEVSGSAYVGVAVGQAYTGTVQNVTVKGNINIQAYWYVGTITGGGYANIYDCKVLANEGSTITYNGGYGGGIAGFRGEGNTHTERCYVENLTIVNANIEDATNNGVGGRIGGITGIAQYGNVVSDNELHNVTLILRDCDPDDADMIGAVVGTYTVSGSTLATVSNNTGDVTIIAEESTACFNGVVGGPWSGDPENQIILTDNLVDITWNGETINSKQ